MRCKIVSTTDPPANKSNRLTRTSSASRAIKPTTSSHGNNNFKIKLKHGYSPSHSSSSSIHGCSRTQTRSSTSSAASTSRGNRNHGGNTTSAATNTSSKESAKEMKKSKDSGDHRCNCICANCGLSVNDSGSRDDHHHDVALIREPINLGTKNVRQILQCVHNGTPEIKDIVLNECNIIYECRVCRNLFRSLANLLSHKRFYCKDHRCETMLLFDDKYLAGLPEEDDIFANFQSNFHIQSQNITTKATNDKTTSEQSTTSIPKVRNRRKPETTFAGPIDPRDKLHLPPSNPLQQNEHQPQSTKSTVSDDGNIVTKKLQPETVASKRKHLESFVNKLLHEKSSPKVDQLTSIPQISDEITSFCKQSEETNEPDVELLNMDDSQNRQDEQKSTKSSVSSPPAQEDVPMKEIETSVSTSSTNQTTTAITTSTATKSNNPTTSVVFNIDENANHPVAGEENESNMQYHIPDYPQSISSLVSDEGSHMSEIFRSEENSEMESIEVDEDIITLNNKEASQQSLLTSSSSSPSASASSSPSSSTREHSSNRNKPKTFDDTYETKPPPLATVPCSMCNSKFISKKTLNVHIQTIHNVQRLIYPCPFCCLTFKQLFNATRHMIQVHRKGKTQVKFLREAVKRRAYPEVKSDENGDEIVKSFSTGGDDLKSNTDDNPTAESLLPPPPPPPPMDNLVDEEEDKSNPDKPFNLKAVPVLPIIKVGKSSKRKNCDSSKEEYKSSSSSSSTSSSSVKCSSSSPTEIKLTINHKPNNGNEVNQATEILPKPSLEIDKKDVGINLNQEKVRRVNPIIFSCINNCGEYFIKVDSKNQHEKKCSKPDDDDDNDDNNDDDDLANQEKSNCNLTDSANTTSHNHHHHHHHHHHRSRDGLDLTIITESIYKELEKVGNLTTRRCNHCPDLQFKTKSLFIQHLIVHIGYEVLKCKKCAYQTLNRTEMDIHLGSAHGTPEILRGGQIVNLSTSLDNDTNGSTVKKSSSRVELKEDSQESLRGTVDETKGSSEKSNSSSIVLHLRPKLSRSRKKKKIYEIVGD